MAIRALLLLILMTGQALAGAWPRERGHGFFSFSIEYAPEDESFFTAAFAEYGLTGRITAGVDLGFSDDTLYKAVAFGRVPLSDAAADWKTAFELGIGVTEDNAVLRPGLSFGRGFNLAERSGWLSIESRAIYEIENNNVEFSTDVTVGLNMTDALKLLVQVQSGDHPMDPDYLNLAPSVVFEASPGLHLELGMKAGLKEQGDYAVKLGLWHHF